MNNLIVPSCYLAPINIYKAIINSTNTLIDAYENFIKQTFRNRCEIYNPNGKLSLIIPLLKKANHTHMKEVEIDYSQTWQKIHWKSLESSYRRSPYFEFYEDDFRPFYESKKWKYLIDFNQELQQVVFSLLDIEPNISFTDKYYSSINGYIDFRSISPKKHKSSTVNHIPYIQTFQEKQGFIPNLSIIDLLFNEGNNSVTILTQIMQ